MMHENIRGLRELRKKVLSDCPPQNSFWTCNGTICRNIYELMDNIRALNDYAFKYHVNQDKHKNDFADWIRHVLDDEELALRLQGLYDKERYIDIIQRRVWELQDLDKEE